MSDTDLRMGIYGGAFDPPHASHVMIAAYALSCMDLGHLLVVPCADHPFGKNLTSFVLRMEMARLAFGFLGKSVEVLDIEENRPGPSYTIDTVKAIKDAYPGAYFVLLVGSDNAAMDRWHRVDELRQMIDIRVMARGGQGHVAFPPISSTMIRERVRQGLDITGLVPARVAAFIAKQGLYRGGQ